MRNRLAIALLSGGLDSTLAAAHIIRQPRIDVIGYHFRLPFDEKLGEDGLLPAEKTAFSLGIPIFVDYDNLAFIEMMKKPKHVVGQGVNPCSDCRIFMLRRAFRVMGLLGADFIITGEVLGQRPLSQVRSAIVNITSESGANDRILRPLSAKHFPPTLPEREGWIDRNRMLDFHGRGRKPQIALAKEYGIFDFPTPAGGCILTHKTFALRFRELLANENEPDEISFRVLSIGRHFRMKNNAKVVIGRNETECKWLENNLLGKWWIFKHKNDRGAVSATNKKPDSEMIGIIGSLTAFYGGSKNGDNVDIIFIEKNGDRKDISVAPLKENVFDSCMIYER